jgi:hypothetical protein
MLLRLVGLLPSLSFARSLALPLYIVAIFILAVIRFKLWVPRREKVEELKELP